MGTTFAQEEMRCCAAFGVVLYVGRHPSLLCSGSALTSLLHRGSEGPSPVFSRSPGLPNGRCHSLRCVSMAGGWGGEVDSSRKDSQGQQPQEAGPPGDPAFLLDASRGNESRLPQSRVLLSEGTQEANASITGLTF